MSRTALHARASGSVANTMANDSLDVQPLGDAMSAAFTGQVQGQQNAESLSRQPDEIPAWKRLLDLTCVLLAFPLWAAVMGLVSLWVLIVSPGPLLFCQERIGYRGRPFMILKFRTMHVNAETKSHEGYFEKLMQNDCPMTKLDICGDARLIRGGRILRALGLDELPQIFNVVRGEMSLVGPRPCMPNEFAHYLPAQKERVNAPPGITGYWQVNGKNKTSFSQMISMDIYYGEHMSVLMDLMIMLKTFPAIGLQVYESLKRKTGARIGQLLKQYVPESDAVRTAPEGELDKEARRKT
jgi:lipopolysaccharide/colanic/teichoic acid biosynthesis glycosyltransferase